MLTTTSYDEYVPILLAMPRYYDTYGIKEPTGRLHTIKAFAEGEPELTVAQIMSKHPEDAQYVCHGEPVPPYRVL